MICYECSLAGNQRDAIGLCHFCSAGLCTEHANEVSEEIRMREAIVKTVVLPRKARRLLCPVCRAALEQPHVEGALQEDARTIEEKGELVVH